MQKVFMPELTEQERIQVMRNNANLVEETTYEKVLTQEDLDVKWEMFVDNDIKLAVYEDELNAEKEKFKTIMNPLKALNNVLRVEVKTKKQKVKGTLFHMANHDTGFMETYEANGELIATRRLKPDEKEPTRLFIAKQASNGE